MNHVTWEVMICKGLITCSFTEKWGMWRWDKPDVKVSTWPTPLIKATKGSPNTCNSPQYGVTGCSYSTRLALCSNKHSNTRSPKTKPFILQLLITPPSPNPNRPQKMRAITIHTTVVNSFSLLKDIRLFHIAILKQTRTKTNQSTSPQQPVFSRVWVSRAALKIYISQHNFIIISKFRCYALWK